MSRDYLYFNGVKYYPSNYEGYWVSRCGKILSVKKDRPRVLKLAQKDRYGYTKVNFYLSNFKIKHSTLDRVLCEMFVKKPDYDKKTEQLRVVHIDGDLNNNNIDNLQWLVFKKFDASIKINMKDAKDIREKLKQGCTALELSKKYAIGLVEISHIKNNKRWIE